MTEQLMVSYDVLPVSKKVVVNYKIYHEKGERLAKTEKRNVTAKMPFWS